MILIVQYLRQATNNNPSDMCRPASFGLLDNIPELPMGTYDSATVTIMVAVATVVCESNTSFKRALALRPSSGNCSPAPDLVFYKPSFQMDFFSGGVFFHGHRYCYSCCYRYRYCRCYYITTAITIPSQPRILLRLLLHFMLLVLPTLTLMVVLVLLLMLPFI